MEQAYKTEKVRKRGICVLCGNRVTENQEYLTAEEGYCHTSCLKSNKAV